MFRSDYYQLIIELTKEIAIARQYILPALSDI